MSNYKVELIEDGQKEEWNRYVEDSPMSTIFHTYSFLKVVEKHTNTRLHTIIGYKGQHPIGLFPFFEMKKGPFSMVFSPPPEVGVPYIGPLLLNYQNLKQRKRESRHKNFIEKTLEYIRQNLDPSYYLITTCPEYDDIRHFKWHNFSASPKYTYQLDLAPTLDDIIKNFRKSKRKNIEQNLDENYMIDIGGKEAIKYIYNNKKGRYNAQGKKFRLGLDYFLDLNSELSPEQFVTYIASLDDEYVSGFIVLMDEKIAYCWQGAGKADVDLPINDLIYWKIIKDCKEKGIRKCDFVGANTPRICKYKSEFNPSLVSYHEVKKSNKRMDLVEKIYKKVSF